MIPRQPSSTRPGTLFPYTPVFRSWNFVVRVEDLGFVQVEDFDDVLIGVRMYGFFEGLTQQELTAFRCGDVPVCAQYDVVGGKRVGGNEEPQVAFDDAALVFGQAIGVLRYRRDRKSTRLNSSH